MVANSATTNRAAPLQDSTVVEADQFPIKSVMLYNSGGAEITRTFPLSFLRSQDDPQVFEIVHLPKGLESVHVSVTSTSGNVTILDHYHTSVAKHSSENSTPSSQTLRELTTEQLQLEDERRLRQQSFTFLTTYMDSLAQCKSQAQSEAAQMVSFFDEFVEIGVTRSAVIAGLDAKLADVTKRITEERERLLKRGTDLPVRVVTVLSCNSQVPVEAAELTVSYAVRQVSWKPTYDLHVAMAGNIPSPTVRLDFRCAVTQWTGENWENVSLALTTADQVSQLIQLPEPKRIDISLRAMDPVPFSTFVTHPPQPMTNQPRDDTAWFGSRAGIQAECNSGGLFGQAQHHTLSAPMPPTAIFPAAPAPAPAPAPPPPPAPARAFETPVVIEAPQVDAPSLNISQLITYGGKDPITHVTNGCVFIPSDHSEHHVLVASLSLQAEYMRVVAPSTDTRVYYTCEVKNTSEHVLLPGAVKTYLNDKHVSSTDIHSTELPQILECSLAVDTGVKTIHSHVPDALPTAGAFTAKATTTYTSATVIHNTHAEPIRGVVVRSAIPLPADPRISIMLKEPAGLAETDEGSVSVKEGCLARWSTTRGRNGKQAGLFEWVCDVDPGTEVLKAVWEVSAPRDLKLFEQARS